MAVSTNFRTLAFAMRNAVTDTYMLLNAVDAVESTVEGMVAQGIEDFKRDNPLAVDTYGRANIAQEVLNLAAAGSIEALREVAAGRKIQAIKAVSQATNCGLKGAKAAVESETFSMALKRHNQSVLDRESAQTQEYRDYQDAMSAYCCEDCNGPEPVAPLPQWERELLNG